MWWSHNCYSSRSSVFLLIVLDSFLFVVTVRGNVNNNINTPSNKTTIDGCGPPCLRCGVLGCIKCPGFIVHGSRECVDACPGGHGRRLSTSVDYMGQMCIRPDPSVLAILVGVCTGAVLCIAVILTGVAYLHYKKRRQGTHNEERRQFLVQLNALRPHAHVFLQMLNDTRRQVRELHQVGDVLAEAAYRPVLKDLAKVLLLLNRRTEHLSEAPPEDWDMLLSWAEKVLKSYRRASEEEVAQLINFLQTPEPKITLSTFKPPEENSSPNTLTTAAIQQQNSREYLNRLYYIEDGYLGFRPQDEITTEL